MMSLFCITSLFGEIYRSAEIFVAYKNIMTHPLEHEWRLIATEAHYIRSLYWVGFEELTRAGLHAPGRYLASLYSLSLAIERMGKLCYVLFHIQNGVGEMPNLKKELGHKLENVLFKVHRDVISPKTKKITVSSNEIIVFLQSLLDGKSRYFTLDTLSGGNPIDPLPMLKNILLQKYNEFRNKRWAKNLYQNALKQAEQLNAKGYSWFADLDGHPLHSVELFTRAAVYEIGGRGLRADIIEIIKPMANHLMYLEEESDRFPCLTDFFLIFKNETAYLAKLKTWSGR